MDQLHPVAVVHQHPADGFGVADVAGDHKTSSLRLSLTQLVQLLLGAQQHLLANAAAVGQANGATQVSRAPAFPLLRREGGNVAVGLAFAAVFHPAVLKTELQGAHIPCGDQVPGFNAEIRSDLLNPTAVIEPHPHAPGGAERQVVGTKGGAREPQAQPHAAGQLQKGLPPGGGIRFVGINAEMVGLIGDRHAGAQAPLLEPCPQSLALATGPLIGHQQAISVLALLRRAGPLLQPQAKTRRGGFPLIED